jgi:3-hydroxybutyryl-CoA dehydrogenase
MVVSAIRVAIYRDSGHDPFPETCVEPAFIQYFNDFEAFIHSESDIYVDCAFSVNNERIAALQLLSPASILINAVNAAPGDLPKAFIRFNGWAGFEAGQVLEIAGCAGEVPEIVLQFAMACGLTCISVPDQPGMVRPRVVAMIINEAYHALGEGVSTVAEIDIAMKLGTNYPFGPFEWGALIGLHRVKELLDKMAQIDHKYQPAPSLVAAV